MLKNTGRKMSVGIIFTWLSISLINAVWPVIAIIKSDTFKAEDLKTFKPVIVDLPYGWAAAAVFLYYGRNIGPKVWEAIILRLTGIRSEPPKVEIDVKD